jgi:hypothetical protein
MARDVVLGDLQCDGLRESQRPVFGRNVGAFKRRRDFCVKGSNVDHSPPSLPDQVWQRVFTAKKCSGQNHPNQLIPSILREVDHGRDVLKSRVVNQDVEAPKLFGRGAHQPSDVVDFSHVRLYEQAFWLPDAISAITTFAPASAKPSAIANSMPLAPPVTIATVPFAFPSWMPL